MSSASPTLASPIRLLIVDDRVEDAEAIVSTLRNGGIAVRPLRPQNAAELAHMVTSQAVDLVVAVDSAAMPLEGGASGLQGIAASSARILNSGPSLIARGPLPSLS